MAGQNGGDATILFPRPQVMVVRQTEQRLDEILALLETYRSALRQSKPRRHALDPNEVLTYYYRLPTVMADEMATLLPQQIRPGNVEERTTAECDRNDREGGVTSIGA